MEINKASQEIGLPVNLDKTKTSLQRKRNQYALDREPLVGV